MDAYVDKTKIISDYTSNYGLGMGLCLLRSLKLGSAFKNKMVKNGKDV